MIEKIIKSLGDPIPLNLLVSIVGAVAVSYLHWKWDSRRGGMFNALTKPLNFLVASILLTLLLYIAHFGVGG